MVGNDWRVMVAWRDEWFGKNRHGQETRRWARQLVTHLFRLAPFGMLTGAVGQTLVWAYVPRATHFVVEPLMLRHAMPPNTNEEEEQLAGRKPETKDPIADAQMTRAGELYEDVNDIFRLAQRAAVLIVKHRMNISHPDAARIVESWWFGCRRRF